MSADLAQRVSRRSLRAGGGRGWRAALILAALLLWPASAYAELAMLVDDTYIDASSPSSIKGKESSIRIRGGTPVYPADGTGGSSQIGLLKFDLSWIPAGTQVSRARLIVFVRGLKTYGDITVHRIGLTATESCSSWTEGATKWNSAPPINSAIEGATTTLTNGVREDDFVTFDVANLVGDWLSGNWPQCGLALVGSNGINIGFASKEVGAEAHEPMLDITFAQVAGATGPTGPAGSTGPTGATGPIGPTGPSGGGAHRPDRATGCERAYRRSGCHRADRGAG
jgi:hypothetical protein